MRLRVHDVLKDPILVSRESARQLEGALREAIAGQEGPDAATLTVDFSDVQGIAPSFLDELLTIFEACVATRANGGDRRLIVAHSPTRLSMKFEAIARSHGKRFQAQPDGSWLLTNGQ